MEPDGPVQGQHETTPECLKPLYLRAFAGIYPHAPNRPERAHNPKVAGSNPAPATKKSPEIRAFSLGRMLLNQKRVPNGYQDLH
jgi:hypothetical protein